MLFDRLLIFFSLFFSFTDFLMLLIRLLCGTAKIFQNVSIILFHIPKYINDSLISLIRQIWSSYRNISVCFVLLCWSFMSDCWSFNILLLWWYIFGGWDRSCNMVLLMLRRIRRLLWLNHWLSLRRWRRRCLRLRRRLEPNNLRWLLSLIAEFNSKCFARGKYPRCWRMLSWPGIAACLDDDRSGQMWIGACTRLACSSHASLDFHEWLSLLSVLSGSSISWINYLLLQHVKVSSKPSILANVPNHLLLVFLSLQASIFQLF